LAFAAGGCTEEVEKELDKLERSTTNNKALNRKVGAIPLGTSVDQVRAKLGRPDDYQVSKTAGLGKSEYLYYGQWQLSFTDDKLDSKNKY
jgi:phage gpG-like protein